MEYIIDKGIDTIGIKFYKAGGKEIVIDNIHKHPKWKEKLKKILTKCKDLKVIISGPLSLKDILSKTIHNKRNISTIVLTELSFRLFLIFKYRTIFDTISFKDILNKSHILSESIADNVPDLQNDFEEYLNYGSYPYLLFNDNIEDYLLQLIDKAIYEDIPAIYKIKFENLSIFKKLIYKVLCSNGILKINVDKTSKELNISKPVLYIYLDIIENTGIFYLHLLNQHEANFP